MQTTPIQHLPVEHHPIPPHARLPNSAATGKPLLIYRAAFKPSSAAGGVTADAVEAHLRRVGAVVPAWRWGMYPVTHFHSTAHEVLVVVKGRASLCFGGEGNPGRVERVVGVGDVVVVPAGVGHRLLEDLGEGEGEGEGEEGRERFEMVGSYMPGCEWDMCYGREGEEGKVEMIKGLGWFGRDPVYGDEGPVLDV